MRVLLRFYPAILLYALVALLKIGGTDWGTDLPGMHAGIGAMFLLFGASVSHLVFVCQLGLRQSARRLPQSFWVVATIAFVLMFLDATFGVHERYAPVLRVPEVLFLLTYGLMFVTIALLNIKKVGLPFLMFFGAFGLASVGAILGDMSSAHEGLITFNNTSYSFEQALETLGCLLLACAFAAPAVRTMELQPDVAPAEPVRGAASTVVSAQSASPSMPAMVPGTQPAL